MCSGRFAAWPALKPTTPYGQLPLLSIGGAAPIAQSDAMLRYAGSIASHDGKLLYDPKDLLVIEEALGLVDDLNRDWRTPVAMGMDPSPFGYPDDFKGSDGHKDVIKKVRLAFLANALPKYMKFITARLAKAEFMCGARPTVADCALVPVLNRLRSGGVDHVPSTCLDEHKEVCAYIERFMAIPEVKAWYSN